MELVPQVVLRRLVGEEEAHHLDRGWAEQEQPSRHLLVSRPRVVRGDAAGERIAGLRGDVAGEDSGGDLGRLGAGALGKGGSARVGFGGERGCRVAQDQGAEGFGGAESSVEGDEPAGRVAEQDRLIESEVAAERDDVVGHLHEGAGLDGDLGGAALPAQVHEDDVGDVSQRADPGT